MMILLDAGHGVETPGKRSPDASLREYKYCRELATLVKSKFNALGYDCINIMEGIDLDIKLNQRCKKINEYCKLYGAKNCVSISIHCNAAGSDNKWHNARGWSIFISPNASERSKILASTLTGYAIRSRVMGNRSIPKELYWVSNLAMCRDTNCPAVLVENMFQDNKEDVKFLLSNEGRETLANIIVDGVLTYFLNI